MSGFIRTTLTAPALRGKRVFGDLRGVAVADRGDDVGEDLLEPDLRLPADRRADLLEPLHLTVALNCFEDLLAAGGDIEGNRHLKAFGRGLKPYLDALRDPRTLASLRLTVLLAAIVVPLNTVFGIAAAWAITRFRFPGKPLLVTLIDLPFAISPVVVGVMLLVLFGAQGFFGPWLREHDFRIVFALPGMVLAIMLSDRPGVTIHLVESIQKKCRFLEDVAQATGASAQVHWTRAEALSGLKADVITARAVAPLDKLLGMAWPFFADHTIGLFLKGKSAADELTLATKSWKLDSTPVPSRSDPSGTVLRVTGLSPWRKPKKPS